MSTEKTLYAIRAAKMIQSLEKRGHEAYYCPTKDDALNKALELIPEGCVVSWGGSQSILEIGLTVALANGKFNVIDRDKASDLKEREKLQREALGADYYLMSANAITLDGMFVNIDGNGNRLAALVYGPRHVIVVAGVNKIEPDLKSAYNRAKKVAAPLNAMRLGYNAPCVSAGICQECFVEDCICSQILVTRMSKRKGRIKVILVGESLGL